MVKASSFMRWCDMRARILIVDDDELYLEVMQELIAAAGYQPIVAKTFEDAQRAIGTAQPDLLIVDVRLGPFNGLQLIAARRVKIPAIVVTGFDDPVLRRDAAAVGAAYVVKPVLPDQLCPLIEQQLASGRAQREQHGTGGRTQ
jgi:DNA-binding response OmpR family regulator